MENKDSMDIGRKSAAPVNPLAEYFNANDKNIIHKWIHYFDIYHRYFQRFVGTECVVVEIGVGEGGSLPMWKHYFGADARIFGIDNNMECLRFEEENITVFIGSQSDRNFLRELKTRIPKIDILIDDGGHTMEQQITTFEEMFDHIAVDGIYLCEDTHTSYWQEYGGGLNRPGTFIEYSKTLIDKLNAWYVRNNELQVSEFTRSVGAVHFYDSVVVVEKEQGVTPTHEKRGREAEESGRIGRPDREAEDSGRGGRGGRLTEEDLFGLKMEILGINLGVEATADQIARIEGIVWPDTGETMIGYRRLTNIEYCMKETIRNRVAGDVIETGVWRGGSCIFMRALLEVYGVTDKTVWVADSFEGVPPPDLVQYPEDAGINLYTCPELAVTMDEVKANFRKYGLLDDQVKFLKGWFKDTMPTAPVERLSVLRLDGDLYESTLDVLFYLYPKLTPGGYCIIDDWGAIPACRKAVEDYRRISGIDEEVHEIDWTGVYWKKSREIDVISRLAFNSLLSRR